MEETVRIKVDASDVSALVARADREKALVVMCHGGPGGHKGGPGDLFGRLSAELSQHRMSTVRFDFRGSGDSDLPFSFCSIDTMSRDLAEVVTRVGANAPVILLAESLGATVALSAGIRSSAQVLLWPALDLSDTSFSELYTAAHLAQAEQGDVVDLGWEKFSSPLFKSIFTCKLYERLLDQEIPRLFLHGEKDTDVPVRQSVLGARIAGSRASLVTVKEGTHGLKGDREQAEAISIIVKWLRAIVRKM